jgi:hypothetical protein
MVAAMLAALGGLLYVPQNGIITPNIMRVEDSIWMVIWVALGGRGKLWGAVVGALTANFVYSMLTSDMPRAWPFIQGGLFLLVLVFPDGLSQLWSRLEEDVRRGGTVVRAVGVLVFVQIWLVADRFGVFPRSVSLTEFASVPAKHWILIAIVSALLWRLPARAALPLFGVSALILSEAFGLTPPTLSMLKYLLVLLLVGVYAAGERDWALLRTFRQRLTGTGAVS